MHSTSNIMILTEDHTVFFDSDLKDFGYTEDGEKFIGEVFHVTVETPQGDRYIHERSCSGVKVVQYEDGVGYHDQRVEARAYCERMVARILAAGKVDLCHWYEGRPCYGSFAYQAYGRENDLALELMEG